MRGYGVCEGHCGGSLPSFFWLGVFSVYPSSVSGLNVGYIRPESIGAVYKIPYFGGNEPFRIYLPPAVEKLVELLPRTWMRRVPRYIATISPFVVMWDYKWLQAQRSPGSQVQGLREYRELQVIVLITRCVAWGLTQWTSDAVLTMWASVFLGTISMIVRFYFLHV